MGDIREQLKVSKKQRHDWKQATEFVTSTKNVSINKDNQLLLNKLVEIQAGKRTSVPKAVGTP